MIDISFNKNIELVFGLMYSVNKDYGINPPNFFIDTIPIYCDEFYNLYKKTIEQELIDYIKNRGLDTYNRTVEIALAITKDYNILEDKFILKIKKQNPNFDKEKLERLMKSFVKKANYDEFYLKHKELFNSVIQKYKTVLNKFVPFNDSLLTDFYGYKIGEMSIILYNFTQGSFGYHNKEKIININCIPNKKSGKNNIEFSPYTIMNCFHEFSHPYMNPLGNKYFRNINLSSLYEEAKECGLQPCYNTYIILINEYMVRAATIYLGNKYLNNKEYMEKHIGYNKKIGYKYIEGLVKLFAKKRNYQDFEEFYQTEVVNFFKEINRKKKRYSNYKKYYVKDY